MGISGFDVELKRMSDEAKDDYVYRVCRNKDLGIYDMTWVEVSELLNSELNQDYNESKYRKNYQVMRKGIEMYIEKNADDEDRLEEIRLATLELEMKKKKVQTESVYYNRILREHSREEMLFDRVGEAISRAELVVPEFNPLKPLKSDTEWLLGIADVHAYKYFKSLTNEYSKEILEQRMNELLGELVEKIDKEGIREITVLNGGDNLENILRNSALMALELGVIDTIVEYRRFILEWLNQLSKYVSIRYIHLISANHSEMRPLNSRAGQFPKEDLEKIIANYVYDMCKDNPRIEVIIPEHEFAMFEIAGYNVIAHHGHGIRNKQTYVERMTRTLRTFIDYGIFSHFHHSDTFTFGEGVDNDCEIIGLPSIMGTDEYADSLLVGAKASALLFKFERGKGRTQENKFILN